MGTSAGQQLETKQTPPPNPALLDGSKGGDTKELIAVQPALSVPVSPIVALPAGIVLPIRRTEMMEAKKQQERRREIALCCTRIWLLCKQA